MRARQTVAACALGWPLAANAGIGDDHRFGLGVALGDPTAITGKWYLGGGSALEAQIGDGNLENQFGDGLYLHTVYLWQPAVLAEANNVTVPWHIGVGGALWEGGWCSVYSDFCTDGDLALAVRAPVGLDVNLGDPRFQFFGDLALSVLVVPDIDLGLGLQIGARYYF